MTASASVAVITVTGTARLNAAAKPKRGKSSSARDHFGLDIFTHHSLRLPTLVTSLSVIKRLSFIDWRGAGAQPPILSGCHLAPQEFVQRWPQRHDEADHCRWSVYFRMGCQGTVCTHEKAAPEGCG